MGSANELSIRSRRGWIGDLVPIYSLPQLILNLLALGGLLWLSHWLRYVPTIGLIGVMLGWVFQFMVRPCLMTLSIKQADFLGVVLQVQGVFERSELDNRWRRIGEKWWQRWPHQFIEISPGDEVTVTASRDLMESVRDSLEFFEEQGELRVELLAQPFAAEPEAPPPVPWHMHVPTAVLGLTCAVAFIWVEISSGFEGMGRWGISARAMKEGRFDTILLHMIAHGSMMHLVMNVTVLAAIGATLSASLGRPPLNWLRFLLLFVLCGLAGAALYLALHPAGTVPMVGASGGIYGLFGLLIRLPANGGELLAIKSTRTRRIAVSLVQENLFLFALLALISWSSGFAGGLAWEAHLGGFLFGLFLGPKLLPPVAKAEPSQGGVAETFVPAD